MKEFGGLRWNINGREGRKRAGQGWCVSFKLCWPRAEPSMPSFHHKHITAWTMRNCETLRHHRVWPMVQSLQLLSPQTAGLDSWYMLQLGW